MNNALKMPIRGMDELLFPPEWSDAALVLLLISVWLVIGLFAYLNHHTKKPHFRFWAVAWMFYSVYLAAFIGVGHSQRAAVPMIVRYGCLAMSALFMYWGSFHFTQQHRSLRELGSAVLLMLIWSYMATHIVQSGPWMTMVPFTLLAGACVYTGVVYIRHSGHRRGADILGTGFVLWGLSLLALPLLETAPALTATVHLGSASLTLMIIIGMVIDQEQVVAKETYGALLASANNAIFLLEGRTLTVLEVNRAGLDLTGLRHVELVGRPFSEACPGLAGQCSALPEKGSMFGATLQPCCEFDFVRPDGRHVACESTTSVLHHPDHPLLQVSVRDVSERKHLEAQLFQAQKMEAVGRLAGGVAHDFNNILTIIIGHTELLSCSMTERGRLAESVQEIEVAAKRAASLTQQLLAFSRKQVLQPKVLNLNDVVTGMEKMTRRLVGEDIELRTVLTKSPGRITADPGQIEQIVMNLAVNARDAMPRGGQISIETDNVRLDQKDADGNCELEAGDYVMLAITDTGIGMTESVKAHLFEPFFTTKGPGKGTGLGLATCYGIVRQSGGDIRVYSEPDRGTTFRIYFPQTDHAAATAAPPAESAPPRKGSETLLLIEDDTSVRALTASVLRSFGYIIHEAGDGVEALRLITGEHCPRFDLIISDMIMPHMGGRELIENVRLTLPDIKVLFVSGYTDDALTDRGALGPGVSFLEKPFTPMKLARRVREEIDKPNALVEPVLS